MTVKEAIDELKYSRDMCYFDPSTGETDKPYSEECERMAQALDIAIKALECEPVGDFISRQGALDELACMTEKHEGDTFGGDLLHWTGIKTMIENLPAAQPEQRTAQWLINSDGYYPYCSACGEEPKGRTMTDFCPNCGAKIVPSEAKTTGSVAKK